MFYKVFGIFEGEFFSHIYDNEFDATLCFYDASWRLKEGDFLQYMTYTQDKQTEFIEYKEMNPLNMSHEDDWVAGIIRMETFFEAELEAWLQGKAFANLPVELFDDDTEVIDYYDSL